MPARAVGNNAVADALVKPGRQRGTPPLNPCAADVLQASQFRVVRHNALANSTDDGTRH